MERVLPRDLKRFVTKKEGQVKSLEWARNVIGRARLRHKSDAAKDALDDVDGFLNRARVLETEELMQLKRQLEQSI